MLKSKERIGRLDRQVVFIKPIYGDSISNEDKIIGWEVIDSYPKVSAKKIEGSGGTSFGGGTTVVQSDRITFVRQTTWIIRYRADLLNQVSPNIRLVYGTQMYDVVNIVESGEERKRYMDVVTQILDNEYFT